MGNWTLTEEANVSVWWLKLEGAVYWKCNEKRVLCVPFATSEPCRYCLHDEELRVPADRPAGAVGVALVRREPHREESTTAAEEMGSVPGEEQIFLRWTNHPVQTERCPSSDTGPYCCHMWPFLCIRVSNDFVPLEQWMQHEGSLLQRTRTMYFGTKAVFHQGRLKHSSFPLTVALSLWSTWPSSYPWLVGCSLCLSPSPCWEPALQIQAFYPGQPQMKQPT